MQKLVWNDEYCLGILSIDTQHEKLIGIFNSLLDCLESQNDHSMLRNILKNLFDYTKYHFGHEEKLFAKYNYPDTIAHNIQHKNFTKKIEHFIGEYEKNESGSEAIILLLVLYLQNWLIEHILGSDRKYIKFFQEHQIK